MVDRKLLSWLYLRIEVWMMFHSFISNSLHWCYGRRNTNNKSYFTWSKKSITQDSCQLTISNRNMSSRSTWQCLSQQKITEMQCPNFERLPLIHFSSLILIYFYDDGNSAGMLNFSDPARSTTLSLISTFVRERQVLHLHLFIDCEPAVHIWFEKLNVNGNFWCWLKLSLWLDSLLIWLYFDALSKTIYRLLNVDDLDCDKIWNWNFTLFWFSDL